MWKRGKEHLVWQAGRLETYQNTILGLFSAIMKKNGKSFGRLQALALKLEPHNVILKIQPKSYFYKGHCKSIQSNYDTPPKKLGYY